MTRPHRIRNLAVFLKHCQARIAREGGSARTLLAVEGEVPRTGRRTIAPGLSGYFTGEFSPAGRPVYAVRARDCLQAAEAGRLVDWPVGNPHRQRWKKAA